MNIHFKAVQSPSLQTHGTPMINGIHLVPASDTPPVPIHWGWPGWLAFGKFHLIAGAPGTGKTTLMLDLVARFTNGGPGCHLWPDKTANPGGHVIIWSGEDSIEDTIIPRLIAAGANMSCVHVIHGTIEHGRARGFEFKTDLPRVSDELEKNDLIRVIVVDSIVQAVDGDSNKNSDVRKSLAPLIELAERHNCAIVGVTHINKNSKGKDPLDRVTGSLAYGAAARIVMFTIKIKVDLQDGAPQRCVLVRAKSNIGKDDGGFEYQITPAQFQYGFQTFQASKVVWSETPLLGSAKDIVKYAETGGQSENMGAVEAAEVFLKTILAAGPRSWQEIEAQARAADISMGAIKRAKSALRIESHKQMGVGPASPSFWSLAPARERSAPTFTPVHQHVTHALYMPSSTVPPSSASLSANVAQPFTLADYARSPSPLQDQRPWPEPPQIMATQSTLDTPATFEFKNPAPVASVASPDPATTTILSHSAFEAQLQRCIDDVCQRYRNGAYDDDADDPEAFQERVIEEAMQAVFGGGLDYSEDAKLRNALGGINWVAELQQNRHH